jgi:flagellar hook-length control protein FliK
VNDPIAPTNPAATRAEQLNAAVRFENANAIDANLLHGTTAGKHARPFAGDSALNNSATPLRAGGSVASWVTMATGAEGEAFTAQVSRGMSAMMSQRGGAMSMRLTPPELGELRVQMTLSRGVVTAEFQASTAHAHSLLERGMNTLRAALESQGLTVDRLTVHGMAHAAGQSSLRDDSAGQWSSSHDSSQDRSNHDAAGGESRGRQEHTDCGAERRYASADFGDFMDGLNAEGFTIETVAAETGSRAA